MKKIAFLSVVLVAVFSIVSCEKEGQLTKITTNQISATAVLKFSGVLSPTSGISGGGNVKISLDNGIYKLTLENYTIENGPDLKVYLSKTASTTSDFVNLGNATASTVYTIPQQVDLSVYKYVLIHCQQYNHLFATAALTQN